MNSPTKFPGKSKGEADASPKVIKTYQIGDSLGKGNFGRVYRGLNIKTGEVVAIKQMNKQTDQDEHNMSLKHELNLLKDLQHFNIVKYIDTHETPTHLYIVLEYVEGGSLWNAVKKFGVFPEKLLAIYIVQILRGLDYLHTAGIIHRDIKGANILLTKEGTCKLADFGSSANSFGSQKLGNIGTPFWMAPEIISDSPDAGLLSDIWSLGCTVIELLTGEPPYYKFGAPGALYRMVNDPHPPYPPEISPELENFLDQCFQKDLKKRPTAKQLLQHPWIISIWGGPQIVVSSPKKDKPEEKISDPKKSKKLFTVNLSRKPKKKPDLYFRRSPESQRPSSTKNPQPSSSPSNTFFGDNFETETSETTELSTLIDDFSETSMKSPDISTEDLPLSSSPSNPSSIGPYSNFKMVSKAPSVPPLANMSKSENSFYHNFAGSSALNFNGPKDTDDKKLKTSPRGGSSISQAPVKTFRQTFEDWRGRRKSIFSIPEDPTTEKTKSKKKEKNADSDSEYEGDNKDKSEKETKLRQRYERLKKEKKTLLASIEKERSENRLIMQSLRMSVNTMIDDHQRLNQKLSRVKDVLETKYKEEKLLGKHLILGEEELNTLKDLLGLQIELEGDEPSSPSLSQESHSLESLGDPNSLLRNVATVDISSFADSPSFNSPLSLSPNSLSAITATLTSTTTGSPVKKYALY